MATHWRGRGSSDGSAKSWRRPRAAGPAGAIRFRGWRRSVGIAASFCATLAMSTFVYLVFVPSCTRILYVVRPPSSPLDDGAPAAPFDPADAEPFQEFAKTRSWVSLERFAPELSAAGRDRQVVVVHVVGLGGQSVDQGLWIYDESSRADDPPRDQLAPLWDELAKLPAPTKKLVILDLVQGPLDWRWGQLTQPDLAAKIADLKIPNLAVLTSAAPGERSWTSSHLGQSVFSYFLLQGLNGKADGNGDQRVSLDEVSRFVQRHVSHWVEQNRDGRGQHPQLFLEGTLASPDDVARANDSDFSQEFIVALVPAPGDSPSSAESLSERQAEAEKQLEEIWKDRDAQLTGSPWRNRPVLWRRLQEHIRRAEAWRLAGRPEKMRPHLRAARETLKEIEDSPQASPESAFVRASRTGAASDALPLPPELLQSALDRHKPTGPPEVDVHGLVELRRTGERVAWHSFRALLWNGGGAWNSGRQGAPGRWGTSRLETADQHRRRAEDLSFVGGRELIAAGTARVDAETGYEEFDVVTQELQAAVTLHERLLAELPDLAWWAAHALPDESSADPQESARRKLLAVWAEGLKPEAGYAPSKLAQEALRPLEESSSLTLEIKLLLLFEAARTLGAWIDQELDPQPDWAASGSREARRKLWAAVDQELTGLQAELDRRAKNLVADRAAPDAPDPADPQPGTQSQEQSRDWQHVYNALQWSGGKADTRKRLFKELEDSEASLAKRSDEDPHDVPGNKQSWVAVEGPWRGLWALQVLSLGPPGVVDPPWVDWKNAFHADDKERTGHLLKLGSGLRDGFRKLARAAHADASSSASDPAAVYRRLLKAERAARLLHGYDAAQPDAVDPTPLRRTFDDQALCLVMADRYLEDFWEQEGEAWFDQAARQCLPPQLNLNPVLWPPREDLERRRMQLLNAGLRLAAPGEPIALGDDSQQRLELRAEFDAAVPPGVAAVSIPLEGSLVKVIPQPTEGAESGGSRLPVSTAAPVAAFRIERGSAAAGAGCSSFVAQPRLYYRGRLASSQDVFVDPCLPAPLVVYYTPPARTGTITVHGFDRPDIVFVLDCSYSMLKALSNKNDSTRWNVAKTAFQQQLKQLRAQAGPEYRVGVVVFGHQVPIAKVQAANWHQDCETVFSPQPLDLKFHELIEQKLDKYGPVGQSPVLAAIKHAGEVLKPAGRTKAQGLLVVITDADAQGSDLHEPGTKLHSAVIPTREYLRDNPALSVQLIAYGPDAQGPALQGFVARTDGAPQVRLLSAPGAEELSLALTAALRPRRVAVRPGHARSAKITRALEFGETSPGLPTDLYYVEPPAGGAYPVRLAGGEALVFDFLPGAGGLMHRGLEYRRTPSPARDLTNPTALEPTHFGCARARLLRDDAQKAEFVFFLDRRDARGHAGIVERPAEIRIDVVPPPGCEPSSRSWRLEDQQAIPAWKYTFEKWSVEQAPEVRAVWKMKRTFPDVTLTAAGLQNEPRVVLKDVPPLAVKLEGLPGQTRVVLQRADDAGPDFDLQELRVEVGRATSDKVFHPADAGWQAKVNKHVVEYLFGTDGLGEINAVTLTTRASLEAGARSAVVSIREWDNAVKQKD